MRNLINCLTCFAVLLSLLIPATAASAASAALKPGQIANYTETFLPAAKNDADLTVTVEGISNKAGEFYVFLSSAKMTQTGLKAKVGNIVGSTGKSGKVGSTAYLIYKTVAPEEKYAVELTFKCRDFYKGAAYKPDTGVEGQVSLKYKIANTQSYDIANYKVKIYLPKGREYLNVSSPKKNYTVGRDHQSGLRFLEYGLSGTLDKPAFKQSKEVAINAVHSKPVQGVPALVLWVAAISLGTAFFILEYKKLFRISAKDVA
ncbi:MAG: hypothetical protein GYA36_03620 [Veillonellaceae bacterium]|nr:hypothetical protein [Veillonellaceae bacterium]